MRADPGVRERIRGYESELIWTLQIRHIRIIFYWRQEKCKECNNKSRNLCMLIQWHHDKCPGVGGGGVYE